MAEQTKRVRIGEFEFTAASVPQGTGLRGRLPSPVPGDALKALDQLGVDSVLVLADARTGQANSWNKSAEKQGITGVKFLARNHHKNGNGNVCDVYAVRAEAVSS